MSDERAYEGPDTTAPGAPTPPDDDPTQEPPLPPDKDGDLDGTPLDNPAG